jgi:nickel superoxide dismutase
MSTGSQRGATIQKRNMAIAIFLCLMAWGSLAGAHCQVPCGIYDDEGRIQQLLEDTTTIAKATTKIGELASKHDAQSMNQLTRWVNVKEQHATHIITTVAEYFLTQKVKPVAAGSDGYEDYLSHLADHHAVMVAAMKTKQKVDDGAVKTLQQAIEKLGTHYHGH